MQGLAIWQNINQQISKNYGIIDKEIKKYLIIRSLINLQVTDLIRETEKRIASFRLKSHLDAKRLAKRTVSFSKETLELRLPLRKFLSGKLYNHYRVIRMSNKAKWFIQELFRYYIKDPRGLPAQVQKNIPAFGRRRVVCDYIAGMTDRYALDEYKKLFHPYEKV